MGLRYRSLSKRNLALHHLTALDVTASQLAMHAADEGCEYIGIFCDLPGLKEAGYPVVSPGDGERELSQALVLYGVAVNNLEVFQIRSGTDLNVFRDSLAMGHRLGARQATVHLHDENPEHSVKVFGQFCELASGYDLDVSLEFTSFSTIRTLEAALGIVRAAGAANGCIALDLLHFFRNGGVVEMLRDIEPHEFGYIQICDGFFKEPRDRYAEAIKERALPGEGEFPIREIMALVPEHVIVDIEVPQTSLKQQGVNPICRIRSAVEHTTREIGSL